MPLTRVALLLLVLAALQLPVCRPAQATECRAIAGGTPALAAIDAETRLRWIDKRLSVDATRARIYSITWGMAYSTVIIVQLALLAKPQDTGDKAEKIVGASSAFIGVLAGAILPLAIMGDQAWWEKHYARSHGDDPCALLNTAELLLIRGAESEAFGISPLVSVGNFAINLAAGLVLGLGYNRWTPMLTTTLVGIAVGEVQVATQPTDVIEDLRLYRAGQLDAKINPPRLGLAMAPLLFRDGGGASLMMRW